jgi:hypothetical protein
MNFFKRFLAAHSLPTPPVQPPEPVLRVRVLSITGGRTSGGFKIRVEGDNESNCPLGLSGITINVPRINSRERYLETNIQMSSLGCNLPSQCGPGDIIWGFRDDGSFGEKAATCLKIECVRDRWLPHERIGLEAVFSTTRYIRMTLHARVWSTRLDTGDGFGDPEWKTTKNQQGTALYPLYTGKGLGYPTLNIEEDQQGIPAYPLYLPDDTYIEYDGSNYIWDECPICERGHTFNPNTSGTNVCSGCRQREGKRT